MPEPQYLSQHQAADLLGVTTRTVRAYVARGHLPAKRIKGGRTVRIRRADVEAMLEPIPTTAGDVA